MYSYDMTEEYDRMVPIDFSAYFDFDSLLGVNFPQLVGSDADQSNRKPCVPIACCADGSCQGSLVDDVVVRDVGGTGLGSAADDVSGTGEDFTRNTDSA